jgi:energy-coupling factor transport system permease protein
MNPLTKLLFVVIVGFPLLLTLDPVSSGVTLILEAAVMPAMLRGTHVRKRRTLWLSMAIVVGGMAAGLVALLYGTPGGRVWFEFGPVHITDNSLELALATTLRVAALSIPAVLLFATTDMTDLADALAQRTRTPERFVIGSLAGLRTLQLASTDLAQVRRARRARGLPTKPIRQVIPLLVLSLRRAETLSLAMEARGFDAYNGAGRDTGIARTHFRTSPVTWRDPLVIVVAVIIGGVSTGVSIAMGAWTFVIN